MVSMADPAVRRNSNLALAGIGTIEIENHSACRFTLNVAISSVHCGGGGKAGVSGAGGGAPTGTARQPDGQAPT